MRAHKKDFEERNIEVLVFGPEDRESFNDYWEKEKMPFIGFPDSEELMKEYGQEKIWYKLGRMPFQIAVDREGYIINKHGGKSMKDIPSVVEILDLFEKEQIK